jgi:hypothetical protein
MVYLKQVANAYKKVKDLDGTCSVTFGKEHFALAKLVTDTDKDFRTVYELVHYNTLILRVVYNFTTNHLIIQNGFGYSSIDRNNMNALLQAMGIAFVQAQIRNGELMLSFNGKRTQEVIIYMGS